MSSSRCRCSRCFSLNRLSSRLLGLCHGRLGTGIVTTPIILHLLIEFLLCLARPAIGSTTTIILSVARSIVASSTSSTSASVRRALSRDVAVDVFRSGPGNIAAATTTRPPATAARSISFSVTGRAQTAGVTSRALNTVEKRTATATTAITVTTTAGNE